MRYLLLALTLVSTPAYADIITINANDYPLGTDISTMFPGVSIQRQNWVYASGDTSTAPATISGSYNTEQQSFGVGEFQAFYQSVLEFTFTLPTNYLRMDFNFLSDSPQLYAYNAAGQQLYAGYVPYAWPQDTFGYNVAQITLDSPEIARVVVGGLRGRSYVTSFSFDNGVVAQQAQSVPEPSTLVVMSLGCLFAWSTRSLRRSSSS